MSDFEDNLWLAVVRDHGDQLARAGRPARRHRRATRPRLLAGTTVGVVAIATAGTLLLGASTSPAAFAVSRNPDGTVTVNLMRPSGIAGANRELAAMGVRAHIVVQAKTPPNLVCPGGTAPTITFDPASVPRRQVLMITSGQPINDDAGAIKANPGANTGAGVMSNGANHVVRTYSGGGQYRTGSSEGNHVARMYCR